VLHLKLEPKGREAVSEREAELVSDTLLGYGGLEQLERLAKAAAVYLTKMEREHRNAERASRKPNWTAAAVAGACRELWGREHREIESEAWLKYLEREKEPTTERQRIWRFAPKSQNHDAPGVFGLLLNDVLETMNIVGAKGEPVSAAVALRSWRDVQKV
jgi:hypothetical protein